MWHLPTYWRKHQQFSIFYTHILLKQIGNFIWFHLMKCQSIAFSHEDRMPIKCNVPLKKKEKKTKKKGDKSIINQNQLTLCSNIQSQFVSQKKKKKKKKIHFLSFTGCEDWFVERVEKIEMIIDCLFINAIFIHCLWGK